MNKPTTLQIALDRSAPARAITFATPKPLIDTSPTKPARGMTASLRVILCGDDREFVTWVQNMQTGECFWGHYFPRDDQHPRAELDARQDFLARWSSTIGGAR